jgi:hypothetical protein
MENPRIVHMMKQQHQSLACAAAPWAWHLAAGAVRRIEASGCARWLVVSEGRVWLTRSDPQAGGAPAGEIAPPGADLPRALPQDHWLAAGEQLLLPAGSAWLIEAWAPAGTDARARVAMWLPAVPEAAPALSERGRLRAWAWLRRWRAASSGPKLALRFF